MAAKRKNKPLAKCIKCGGIDHLHDSGLCVTCHHSHISARYYIKKHKKDK